MKKVLFVVQRFYPSQGGTQLHSFKYSKELVKLGYQVDIVTTDSLSNIDVRGFSSGRKFSIKSADNNLKRKENMEGVDIFRFRPIFQFFTVMINPPMFFFLMFNLKKYDIIHTFCYMYAEPDMVAILSLFNRDLKIVHSPQDLDVPFKGKMKKLKEIFYDRTLGKLTLKKASQVIVLTNELKNRVQEMGVDKKKISILPIGIDFEKYNEGNLHKRDIDILFVGRFVEYKGIQHIIEAVNLLNKENIILKFVIIGNDNGYKFEMKEIIKKYNLKNVTIFENLSEDKLISYYNRSKFFIFPSSGEGFGGVVLEAIAGGCYPILLKEKGLKDLLVNIGGYSLYNNHSISDQIFDFLKYNYTKDFSMQIKQLQDIIYRDYNWNNITKDLVKIYEKI